MARAVFNGTVVAESDSFEVVEGNVYFPPESLNQGHFEPTGRTTVCSWKGMANYYSIAAGGERAVNAAWTYRDPKPEAARIKDYVAFYPIVTVER